MFNNTCWSCISLSVNIIRSTSYFSATCNRLAEIFLFKMLRRTAIAHAYYIVTGCVIEIIIFLCAIRNYTFSFLNAAEAEIEVFWRALYEYVFALFPSILSNNIVFLCVW